MVGRDEVLQELELKITQRAAAGATISGAKASLQGMGGVGKTALAVALAHRLKTHYPDAQLYLNLHGADPQGRPPTASADVMRNVIHSFQPEMRLPESLDELAPIYRAILAEGEHRNLLLLDNAADADQVQALLPPPNCLLLVTSRAQFSLAGLETKSLDCLPPEKSRELLLKLANRIGADADAAAKLCGYLPLALEVFAGLVNDKKLYAVSTLLDRLHTQKEKLAPVEAAFKVSYDLLSESLRGRWAALAVFPASFDLPAAASVWEAGSEQTLQDLQTLRTASLIEWNENNRRFRLHDLAKQFCLSHLDPAAWEKRMLLHAQHFMEVGEIVSELYHKEGANMLRGLTLLDCELTNIETAIEWLKTRNDHKSNTQLDNLVEAIIYASRHRHPPMKRVAWLQAQRKATSLLGGDSEGTVLNNLGRAYAELGNSRMAIEFYEQALAIAREIGDRDSEGYALGNLGRAYADLGDARKAIDFHERRLAIAHELGDRDSEGAALGNLGNAYADLGDLGMAIRFYEQKLVIAREIGDSGSEGIALGNLGHVYANLGDSNKAIKFHEQKLAIACKINDRIREGIALTGLGLTYADLGDTRKAIDFYERALVILRELGDRRGEGNVLGNLGNAYADLGDARKAIDFHEQSLTIAQDLGDRSGEGYVLGNLGNAYAVLGDARKAIDFHEQRLAIAQDLGDRRDEGSALYGSALSLHKLGQQIEAIARAEAALVIYVAIESPTQSKVRATLEEWRKSEDRNQENQDSNSSPAQ